MFDKLLIKKATLLRVAFFVGYFKIDKLFNYYVKFLTINYIFVLMDKQIEKVINLWNSEFNKNVLGNPENAKIKASGASNAFLASPKSLKIRENGFSKIGLYPMEQDKGRGATKNRTGGHWKALYDWLAYRKYGFNWKNEKERKQMTFALWKVASQKGSWKHRNPDKQTRIYQDALDATFPILYDNIGKIKEKQILYAL